MNINIDGKRITQIVLTVGLLTLYFLGVSILSVGLALPYAFVWLMYTLNGIRNDMQKEREEVKKQLSQIEAR